MIKIFSKTELSEKLKKEVIAALEKYLKNKVKQDEVSFEIDEKIMSGVKIEIDSEIIDLTLNNRLEKILEVLNKNA